MSEADIETATGISCRSAVTVWVGFAMMCVGMFMAILDVQVVATSIPTIQEALKVAPDDMSWVQTAYLVAEVVAIPLTGFLTRLLTIRGLFVAAIVAFTCASIGCAASDHFGTLICWRILQGFSGGTLIPAVFSAVFVLFPPTRQGVATTIAGILAVLAPTVGPIVGGWITQTYSWHWLFLINVLPGVLTAAVAPWCLPPDRPNFGELRKLDWPALLFLAFALAALVIGLKQAPRNGWGSPVVIGLFGVSILNAILFVRRTLKASFPLVELATLRSRPFAVGCFLSFVLGIGLYGSTYMMPVFLNDAHDYDALQIGQIMLVTGVAQIISAPIAIELEKRVDARLLSALGFLLFAIGLGMSAFESETADYEQMFWPQVVRGVAIMFCLLPPTRLALGWLATEKVPDASGLFNLMRNLGGAIGLALIDTVLYGRGPHYAGLIEGRLRAGDTGEATAVGIPLQDFQANLGKPLGDSFAAMVRPMIENLAIARAMNEAWGLVALLTVVAIASLLVLWRPTSARSAR